jgi:serine/threonine protein kinase
MNSLGLKSGVSQKDLIRMQSQVGTPWYTAPEVFLKDYTQKCDIWSAGVMLYVMLVGFPPFFSQTELEIQNEILNGNYDFSGKK